MKKLLLLSSNFNQNKKDLSDYLHISLKDLCKVDLALFSQVGVWLDNRSVDIFVGEKRITEYSVVYIRKSSGASSIARTVALYLSKKKIKYFDKTVLNQGVENKLTDITKLALLNTEIIPTFYCSGENLPQYKNELAKRFGFPIVAKELTSQRMTGVYLVNNLEDFDKLPKYKNEMVKSRYLFQKYISIDKEYRLLVTGDKVGSVHLKTTREQDGIRLVDSKPDEDEVFIDLANVDKNMCKIAVEAAEKLDIQIAGVDVCVEKGTNKIYIVEVNRGPGLFYKEGSPELSAVGDFFRKILVE